MSKREEYEKRTEKLLEPVLAENRFELVDVEYVREAGNRVLRAYIDKPGGITLDDCELVTRTLSDLLDEEDFIDESYVLEVSSPGLERPLRKDRDFERSIGKKVELHTYRMVDKKKDFCGVLKAFDADTVTIEDENGEEKVFLRESISGIHLALDF